MCGICGLVIPNNRDLIPETLRSMNASLTHRGPDDAGEYCHNSAGIAMRRLSIIDIDGGHQPIFSEDGRQVIVFNGEIYNYRELMAKLRDRGHKFSTSSDTEVILHLFEDEAEETPKFLKGMFAFCIYDLRRDSLYIARDRFGEKPLFYYSSGAEFIFSSELKSLLACPLVPRILDQEALGYYLRVGVVPTPLTMFKDIHVLPPGHWLKWQRGELQIVPYYEVDYRPNAGLDREQDAVEAVQAALRRAVKRQAISDVPLGAFLSGGIDSSAVVSMLQAISERPVKTFTMRFEDAQFDEGLIARQVAQHLGTEHHEFVVPNMSFDADVLWRIVDHIGMPFIDDSAIPTYILSKHIRQEVTVALSGDGGDELFAGYRQFQWGQGIRSMQRLPLTLLRSSASVAQWLAKQRVVPHATAIRRMQRGLTVAASPHHLLPVMIHAVYEPHELQNLLNSNRVLTVANGDLPLLTDLPPQAENWSVLRQLMYYRLKHNLHGNMLAKVDRMSMAASIEVRAPLLDVDLAELSMRIPDKHLVENGIGKSVLRKAIKDEVPDIVFSHPKTGFSVPMHRFQNDEYRTVANELLDARCGIMQLFSQSALNRTVTAAVHNQSNSSQKSIYRSSLQLWGLMQLSAWGQRFEVRLT